MTNVFETAAKMTELKKLFVQHERFDPLYDQFQLLMQKRLADIKACEVNEAHGIALSGGSGAGKSRAIDKLVSRARKEGEADGLSPSAIVSVKIPSPATLKFVGQKILRALNFNLSSERQAWYIWDLVHHQLREQNVLFLHLDEAQDLSKRGSRSELNEIASMLKSIMSDPEWPVGILLSGTPELESILNHDPQLSRRMKSVRFTPITTSQQAPDIQELLGEYAAAAQVSLNSEVSELIFAKRIIHAAANEFGLVIELILAAIEEALIESTRILERRHFEKAYLARTACSPALNPFVATDFYRINTRQVFAREDSEHAYL